MLNYCEEKKSLWKEFGEMSPFVQEAVHKFRMLHMAVHTLLKHFLMHELYFCVMVNSVLYVSPEKPLVFVHLHHMSSLFLLPETRTWAYSLLFCVLPIKVPSA
jgi:hypothetical protein